MRHDAPISTPSFDEDLTNALVGVRGVLGRALSLLGVAPDAPQDIARRLGISRNLTWKISKVLCSEDVFEAVLHLPGEEGLEIFVGAMADAGVDLGALDRVRESAREFDRIVALHAGDRATLDLMLDGMVGSRSPDRLEQSRKLAFRGNSGLWGIQCRARLTAFFAAPNADDPSMVDSVLIGGIFDVRRLRPLERWPIFYPRAYHDDGTSIDTTSLDQPIDEGLPDRAGPHLMRAFCTPSMPEIRSRPGPTGPVYEFGPGPIGNMGLFSMVFGTLTPRLGSRSRSDQDQFGESSTQITMPTGALQFDMLVHRSLRFGAPEASVVGRVAVPMGDEQHQEIPIGEQPRELAGRPPMIGSTLIPGYESMVERATARAGWSLREFRAWRLVVQYPPMHSFVRVRFGLEER